MANYNRLMGAVFEHAPDALLLVDDSGRIVAGNARATILFGYPRTELVGSDLAHLLPNLLAIEPGWIMQALGFCKDGSRIAVEITAGGLVSEHDLTILSIRDGTARARAEIEQQASEARLRHTLDHALEGCQVIDHDWRYRYLNDAAAAHGHRSKADLLGRTMVECYPGIEQTELFTVLRHCMEQRVPHRMVNDFTFPDGSHGWFQLSIQPVPEGIFILSVDITEQQRANQRLRTQLAQLNLLHQITRAIGEHQDLPSILQVVIRSLEDELPLDFCGVATHDLAARMLTMTAIGMRSYPHAGALALREQSSIRIDENGLARCLRGQLVYESDTALVPFAFPQRLAQGGLRSLVLIPLLVAGQAIAVIIAARAQPEAFSSTECEFLWQLGEHVALAAHQAQLHSALQQAYEDMRLAQQAVLQQERLHALGQMAAGIAHDINNALSPVMIYTELLLEEPTLPVRARHYVKTIHDATRDVATTIARLREFYRKPEEQAELAPVRLNTLIAQVVELTQIRWSAMPQQHGQVVTVQTELESNLPSVLGTESELREALINLVFNAADAMPDGGTLTLRTRVHTAAADVPGHVALHQVYLDVMDTGIGMDEETRRRCLEPFFTTKGERGSGLGLAMVYGIMQRHGADLEIQSAVGGGTTVRLIFGVPAGSAEGSQPLVMPVVPPPLRLLVVDDDPLVIRSLHELLEADGHTVVTASGGQEGIEVFQAAHARGERFAVVITDLGMPHVDGRQVARAVKTVALDTPVLLLTGWGHRTGTDTVLPAAVDYRLSKPPRLRELREALVALSRPSNER